MTLSILILLSRELLYMGGMMLHLQRRLVALVIINDTTIV
jgi:hypothetical protein